MVGVNFHIRARKAGKHSIPVYIPPPRTLVTVTYTDAWLPSTAKKTKVVLELIRVRTGQGRTKEKGEANVKGK